MDAPTKPPRVTVERFYIPPTTDGNFKMIADLNFHGSDGEIVCVVKGFKLMTRDSGGFWIGVPQREKDGAWIDVFEFGSKSQAEEARALCHATFETAKMKKDDF